MLVRSLDEHAPPDDHYYAALLLEYAHRLLGGDMGDVVLLGQRFVRRDLRHTFASTALAEGVPISEVSRWLGHKSITTSVDLYGHLVPEASARACDALDGAFSRTRMCTQSAPVAA